MASKLYKMMDYVKEAKLRSPDTYNTVETLLKNYSKAHKLTILDAAITIAKNHEGIQLMWLLGVAGILSEEEKEPTPAPALSYMPPT